MSVAGFFILLAITILLRVIGHKLIPVAMPNGRFWTIAFGWIGGFLGSLASGLWSQFGPEIAGINLAAAVIGCALFILFLGIAPFIKILLGKL